MVRLCTILLLCGVFQARAFLPPEDTSGPATLSISGPAEVKASGEVLPLTVTVKNSGSTEMTGTVRLAVIDGWRVDEPQQVSVAPHAAQSLSFRVNPAKDSYASLYPVHAWADLREGTGTQTLHAILIASVSAAAGVAPHSPPGPAITAGPPQKPESADDRLARRKKAVRLARAAPSAWSWKLTSDIGVAIVPGPAGIADAFIAFADKRHELVFDGFDIKVDHQAVTGQAESHFADGRGTITTPALQASVWAESGALRVAFSMPGVQRNPRGEPRFTSLSVGPASELAHRVYAGFGNVLTDPSRFDLNAGGFALSARHVGMDFPNGLSLVQASDIFPDRFHVDPEHREYALVAHHDVTFSFIPSTHGAFDAARVYRKLSGFHPAGGVATLAGRMCLDQWGGDYKRAAADVDLAARYGLTDAVFVKHVWQRWGYDYRLPDIYPPQGNFDGFRAMVQACKRHGILFAPHDNYIDFYPDASGFSYDDISFGGDGLPEKSWLNKGRGAQSYRWSPVAFQPWLEANLKRIRDGFAPTAYFVDVFSALAPMDFYARDGRFYPKTVTAERWGAAFDLIRETLGNNAPTISEAGDDALIGHLDAGEADHSAWLPGLSGESIFRWSMPAADGERVPWHDMASHGSFVLLGGGLGSRYAGGQDETLHGYGSDDYLSLTVLGGRNPMCDGPFSREAVMTYWLLHDVCASLARREMLSDEFAGDDIHRQIVRFSGGAEVRVNRGKTDWGTLPEYGFVAKAGEYEAGITRRAGIISAYAKSPGVLFVDARPKLPAPEAHVAAVEDLGNRRFRIRIDWSAIPPDYKPFLHFVDEGKAGEGIVFQGPVSLSTATEITIPAGIAAPAEFGVRFGLFRANGNGARLPVPGPADSTGRSRGGHIRLTASGIAWTPEPAVAGPAPRTNTAGAMVDFGEVATNGAFRLLHSGTGWTLIPLPGSPAFQVELHLNNGRKIRAVTSESTDGGSGGPVSFRQEGQTVRFETGDGVFAYHLTFAG